MDNDSKGVYAVRKAALILAAFLAVALMTTPALGGTTAPGAAKKAAAGRKARAAKKTECKPVVAFVFVGTVASVGADTVTVDVVEANKHARRFGTPATLAVAESTKIVREYERASLSDVQAGDSVTVQARACKSVDPATTLVARRLKAASPVVEPAP